MPQVQVSQTINAPQAVVFDAVTNLSKLHETSPAIVGVEFLTEQKSGVGTRFIETRKHGKQEMKTELEVTEYREPEHARMVADSHGTIWDTVFTVDGDANQCTLTLTMDARAHKLMGKIMNTLMKGMFRKGMAKHLDSVKAHCESL
ncbi:MAG: SRPBCC family protein [Planctomycetota bacterium]